MIDAHGAVASVLQQGVPTQDIGQQSYATRMNSDQKWKPKNFSDADNGGRDMKLHIAVMSAR
jgi:hypothetical protein